MPLPEFENPSRAPRWAGAAAVVGLHLLAGWALMSGLARQTVESVRQTVEMAIIDAPAPPPPSPPPPGRRRRRLRPPRPRGRPSPRPRRRRQGRARLMERIAPAHGRIVELSEQIGPGGEDKPSTMAMLTAESMRMNFMANSSSTSTDSVGKALETMARKN